MCGSGTILIEAGMMSSNIPAGYYRKDFDLYWQTISQQCLKELRKVNAEIKEFEQKIIGSDRSEESLQQHHKHKKAKLDKDIELRKLNFLK